MLMSMSAFAQEKVKITDIKGVHVGEDGRATIDFEEFLSVPEYKALFVEELNRRIKKNLKKKGLENSKLAITNIGVPTVLDAELTDTAATANVAVGEGKAGKRKANALATLFECNPFDYTYESIDGNKNPITLSARAYVPTTWASAAPSYIDMPSYTVIGQVIQLFVDIFQAIVYRNTQSVLLSCHPTVTSTAEAPTGNAAPENAIKIMTSERALVVCPDYCGYGITAFMQHPYLVEDITARQCIDAELAALDLISLWDDGLYDNPIASDYYTNIIGYSQGGAVALACTKYLESNACPQEVKDKIKLNHTYCGDGPYSPVATVKQYLEWQDTGKVLEYPCVLPLIVMAAKDAYNDDCMRTVKVEDYFSEDFLKSDVINMLKSKSVTTADLNNKISAWMGTDEKTGLPRLMPKDLFSEKMLDENSNEHKCLMRALEKNDLTKGWTPTHKITFYHWTTDGVVPYCNTQAIFAEGGIDAGQKNPNINYYTNKFSGFDLGYPLWQLAGIWGGGSDGQGEEVNHAEAGVVFYVYYMSGFLRPKGEK